MKKRKVGIIGVGHVGAHVAYALLIQGIVDEMVLINKSEEKLKSEVQDLNDAVAFAPHRCVIYAGDYNDLKDCDIIVHAAGNVGVLVNSKQDRNAEMGYTIDITDNTIYKIKQSGFDGVLINVTNPCDVITKKIDEILDLKDGRVFGTGTGLDTSRLLSAISKHTNIDHNCINAFMIGEHGNKQFCPWSTISIKGGKLDQDLDHNQIIEEVIKGGWVTYAGKHCTEYGIASIAARMVKAVLHDEKIVLAASCKLNGEYGEEGIFAGVPCVIGEDGVERVIELPLNNEEKAKFHECCDGIRANLKEAKIEE